jgi:5'-3' exonuclease
MGIQNFYSWLRTTYPSCFVNSYNVNMFDHVYIDMNWMLHKLTYKSMEEKDFIPLLYYQLDAMLTQFMAKKTLSLVFDGPPCHAKVMLQRKRRVGPFCTANLSLTPGTKFMNKMKHRVDEYIESRKCLFIQRDIDISVSSSKIPDEGDLKIAYKIRQNPNDTHLILGYDADYILISILSKSPVYVWAKNNLFSSSEFVKLGINAQNFVFTSIMFGNDYLPKLKYSSLNNLSSSYKSLELIVNNKLNHKDFKKLLQRISIDLKPNFRSIKLTDIPSRKIINHYVSGLLWCYQMYAEGICPKINYFYGDCSIHPLEILYFMEFNPDFEFITPVSTKPPLDHDTYVLLVFPLSARKLLPKHVKPLQDQLPFLYEEENCQTCQEYVGFLKDIDKKTSEFAKHNSKFTIHKKIHQNFKFKELVKKIKKVTQKQT